VERIATGMQVEGNVPGASRRNAGGEGGVGHGGGARRPKARRRRWCSSQAGERHHREVKGAVIFVVSTEGPLAFARGKLRPERRDLLTTIGRLSWREGLSAPRFALRSRRRKSPYAIALPVRRGRK
jgi:hypothetical protein